MGNGNSFALPKVNSQTYPKVELIVAVVLLFLAPFVSELLVFVSFGICLCRVVLYDERVFATDYAVLAPIGTLMSFRGMSLLIYLCLIASAWYLLRSELPKEMLFAVLLLILNYLMLRMSWNISRLVLCFGQLLTVCVLLPKQDPHSAERTIRLFCLSLLISSAYALVFRNASQIYALRGEESEAYFGSTLMRFQGLLKDPNYYMTLLVTAMALLLRMLDCGKIRLLPFLLQEACLCFFGILTYSKTFFLAAILLVMIGIVRLFLSKKYLLGCAAVAVGVLVLVLFSGSSTGLGVVLFRFKSASGLNELTTGRSEVFVDYYNVITQNLKNLLFGVGFAADGLGKDPHNLYLEILYYIGAVGLLLMGGLFGTIVHAMNKKTAELGKQQVSSKYVVLLMALILHISLHGIFSLTLYAVFFLAFLSLLLMKEQEKNGEMLDEI